MDNLHNAQSNNININDDIIKKLFETIKSAGMASTMNKNDGVDKMKEVEELNKKVTALENEKAVMIKHFNEQEKSHLEKIRFLEFQLLHQ